MYIVLYIHMFIYIYNEIVLFSSYQYQSFTIPNLQAISIHTDRPDEEIAHGIRGAALKREDVWSSGVPN